MTREEAIRILYIYHAMLLIDVNHREAFDMAIKALEQEPCEDAISRKDTLKKFKQIYFDNDTVIRCAELILGSMPPVTPQPKMGHWIAQDIHNCHTDFKCSECGYIHNFMHIFGEPIADYTYCPNCGAKMENEE